MTEYLKRKDDHSLEIWDVYDRDRNLTGKTMKRGAPFEEGAHHLVVHVCIFNKEGQMLIQQRQPFKEGWPNMWDLTVGGSAVAGDTSQEAAERE
ncbi:NUDIX domain-containing protein, partial [Pseudomonas sp. 2822-17]|uniref:NUDIX hydrolase n=1 Tax=Pseudomonas sp. 2822-17 TaxID=1712678 RepID=UPI00117B62B5